MRTWFRYAVPPALVTAVAGLVLAITPGGAAAAPALDGQQAVRTAVAEFGFEVTEASPDGGAVPAAQSGCGGTWHAQWTPLPQPVKPLIIIGELTCTLPTQMDSPGVQLFNSNGVLILNCPAIHVTGSTRAFSTCNHPGALVGQSFRLALQATFTATPGNVIFAPGPLCVGSGTPQAFCQGSHTFTVT
jgi:hypothetical protein